MTKLVRTARLGRTLAAALALATGAALAAQTVSDDGSVPNAGLDIPENLQIFGKVDPNVRKATAIVNDAVITQTDVEQRANLIMATNQLQLGPEDKERLKLQILRQLIDETLQIQRAAADKITVTPDETNQAFARVSANFQQTPDAFSAYLRSIGSSDRSVRRQIEGELAWQRYLRKNVEPFVNVGDEEVQGILDRLKASQGTDEYHLKEIYFAAGPDQAAEVATKMRDMLQQIQQAGKPFEYYAQFSQATTRATGGDLGWVRTSTLPDSLAQAAQGMQAGQVAGPIEVPGGFSILYLVDKRKVLTADPRDAKLTLKQITQHFPAGVSEADATARAAAFAKAVQGIQGCGSVAKVAGTLNAEVVDNDTVRIRDLPPQLQEIMLKLQVGEATPPFGNRQDGVRALVLCGRDDVASGTLPDPSQVQGQLEQQRVNLRAQQMLRDLRRDAVIDYR